MLLLSIETSCDETAISIVEAVGNFPTATYQILGNALWSQMDDHREFGGVVPTLAKREHIATIVPVLEKAVHEARLSGTKTPLHQATESAIRELLVRENGLADTLLTFHNEHGRLPIDAIAVTSGPGLEPALWVGVNFAKALATLWDVSVVAVNHMEGHVLASLYNGSSIAPVTFPAIALLVSGGHTELILMNSWGKYTLIGRTRDDAVGEAFDKVARLLGLPYPGGPEVSRRASEARAASLPAFANLPRPMLTSPDFDFSFSGLKTAVRYAIAGRTLTDDEIRALARDFEEAAVEVLVAKLAKAAQTYGAPSVIIGGGVAANQWLRQKVAVLGSQPNFSDLTVYLPDNSLSTDNSVMIALAGHAHLGEQMSATTARNLRAYGNKSAYDKLPE